LPICQATETRSPRWIRSDNHVQNASPSILWQLHLGRVRHETSRPQCHLHLADLELQGAVKISDTVVATVKVAELIPEKKRARFDCVCTVNGTPVVQGEAVLMVPSRPA
jgi:hypothetical protein